MKGVPSRFPCLTPAIASLLLTSLLGFAAAQTAPDPAQPQLSQPQPTFTARLLELIPSDYFGRFGSTTAFADSVSGYGIRGLPLPFKADARFTFISHPNYLEYAASLREGDTSYVAGRLQNDDAGATQGVGHLEVTHNPYTGLQYGALLQDQGRSSRFTLGYAWAGGRYTRWQRQATRFRAVRTRRTCTSRRAPGPRC